jgi:uncharacterized protein YndB with AHSA1/START domain
MSEKVMTEATVVHSTFSIERDFKAAPSKVFAAFANPDTKRRWFAEGKGWEVHEFKLDFRVGGSETARFSFLGGPNLPPGAPPAGTPMANDTVYHDIVPDRRIVFGYTMSAAGHRMSASLGTVELTPAGSGTKLKYTEQGAYFEGGDGPRLREGGWRELLAQLDEELLAAR